MLRHEKQVKTPTLICASSLGSTALQSIQGELLNNPSKLTEINKRIKRNTKKLEEVENDPTYTDEQWQFYRDRLGDLNTEKQARLEILLQNRKDLQTQVARIRQTIAKVLDQDTSLTEKICTLFCEQGITIISNTDCPFNDYFNNCPCYYSCFWRRRGRMRFFTKRRRDLEKMVRQVSRCTQKTCRESRWSIAWYCG